MPDKTWLTDFCSSIREELKPEVAEKVLKGFELQQDDGKEELVNWLLEVMKRFDDSVDISLRKKIMKKMGYECAIVHKAHIEGKKKRDQFSSLDEYIANEQQNPYDFKISRSGDKINLVFNPSAMGCNCYCGPWQSLRKDQKTSLSFCYCSAGHHEYIWKHIIGKPVDVDITCSCISGSDRCRLTVSLPPDAN